MRKVDDYIKDKIKKDPAFSEQHELIKEKAKVVAKIIEYRSKHKLTQGQLAHELGVTQQYVSKVEDGDFSNIETIESILHHIGYRLKLEVLPL